MSFDPTAPDQATARRYIALDPFFREVNVWEHRDGRRLPMTWATPGCAVIYLGKIQGRLWREFHEIVRYEDAQLEWARLAKQESSRSGGASQPARAKWRMR